MCGNFSGETVPDILSDDSARIGHCDGADAYFGSGSAGDIIGLCQKCRTILQELYHG